MGKQHENSNKLWEYSFDLSIVILIMFGFYYPPVENTQLSTEAWASLDPAHWETEEFHRVSSSFAGTG